MATSPKKKTAATAPTKTYVKEALLDKSFHRLWARGLRIDPRGKHPRAARH
ncbi:UNVERIFIED_ORG: hypothetical protein J2Y81_007798 [Paraburkholderia sediminicola]|nr:hypothetical protein [Paraburkholderia sediminicola]